MKLSDKLAQLNAARFEAFETPFSLDNAKQAVLAFKGRIYRFRGRNLNCRATEFAQRIAILSGLYGLLKPLDLIQAYRLEMGTKFANARGKDLYCSGEFNH